MLRFPALLLLLASATANAQTDPALWRFIHPNAKALISIDWRHIRQSHVGTMLREKWVDAGPGANIPGVEFLNDVDRVVISSAERNPGDTAGEPPVLIVVRGHFDLAKARRLLTSHGARPQMFNSFQVYRPQGKNAKDMAFVLLDAQTILVGDSRSIFSSLERNAFPGTPDANSIPARAAELDANYEFWAIMSATSAMANDRLMGLFTGGDLSTQARGFEFGVSLKNGLIADNAVMFQSESAAKTMAGELSKLVKVAIKEKMGEPAMLDLEKKLKIYAEGTLVRIRVRMTPQELEKNAQIFAASRKQPATPLAGVRPVVTPISPPLPEKSVIRIEGLDEGPREIPYKRERPLP
jgi:hypothetical protein